MYSWSSMGSSGVHALVLLVEGACLGIGSYDSRGS
jgi:hypothetical protein